MSDLEKFFEKYRKNTIGHEQLFESPYGTKKIVYADWVASGRLYAPIEKKIQADLGPFVGNTHTETSITGTAMTKAYHEARKIIKEHVNAGPHDVIINAGSGMTAVVNKLQRILGLKAPEQLKGYINIPTDLTPVVFITHMEHHSNHTSWLETLADVVILEPDEEGLVDLNRLEEALKLYENRKLKIGSFTACSNVTGIRTDYYKMAKIMHRHNGICFVDFAASAPYVDINMHPEDPEESLDAIFFSPHKFLGGPGTAGVLIFNSNLYTRKVPDHPGGGTVDWTNPWGQHKYVDDIENREDGGTPAFLQTIRTALAIKLKEEMSPEKMLAREEEMLKIVWNELESIPKLHLLADMHRDRLSILSFYLEDLHYNLIVKLLNDRFGIQVRGGCSCAGTYGHYLLHVDPTRSKRITEKINKGDLSEKPGWVRLSLHPTMTDDDVRYILNAIKEIIDKGNEWGNDYTYDLHTNEFTHKNGDGFLSEQIDKWFRL